MPGLDDLLARYFGVDIEDRFREIGDDMVIRSRLKAEDLRLVRRAFIGYIKSGGAGSDEGKCEDLFRRMLRKV